MWDAILVVKTTARKKTFVICAFYKFVSLKNYKLLQPIILEELKKNQIKGTILLATEGINGTIAGPNTGINKFLSWIQNKKPFIDLTYKLSFDNKQPFLRTKVKLKKEIVTMGKKAIDPNKIVGTYVKPVKWNQLISDPNVVLIDTRNDYEVEIGTFKNSINPKTTTFREFPAYVQKKMNFSKNTKVATFCTGGIRCEKATAYLKQKGYKNVFHLEGGILKYLESVPKKESMWKGECFVFDNRVSVDHSLKKGRYDQCHACRYPISKADKLKKSYIKGVSCPRCFNKTSKEKKDSLRERQRQVALAKKRGEYHIGSAAAETSLIRKKMKKLRGKSF